VADKIQAIRGMNDILPHEITAWHYVEQLFKNILSQYAYQEIRFPIVENTRLFKRSLGEITDVVEKEMYTFDDLNGDSLTLRPEGTACCVRACLEHGLINRQAQKLWYLGPMFRHEKPQKGRYRQFHQLGVEAFGYAGHDIEIELIALCIRLWRQLGIEEAVTLELNTLGELSERQAYKLVLVDYFQSHFSQLDSDSQRRLHQNPLRILDSKNPEMQSLIENAPKLIDALGEESQARFNELCQGLDALNIPYKINPRLVRGLDYYGHTVFEWVTTHLGSQATVCAGGRFDALIEQSGGSPTPAVGFALGVERLILLISAIHPEALLAPLPLTFYMIIEDSAVARYRAQVIAERLRDTNSSWRVMAPTGGSFKSQFKKADKSEAQYALILGEDEITHHTIGFKNLRVQSDQVTLAEDELTDYISRLVAGE
jgi:histidyl-tRNA synthetase